MGVLRWHRRAATPPPATSLTNLYTRHTRSSSLRSKRFDVVEMADRVERLVRGQRELLANVALALLRRAVWNLVEVHGCRVVITLPADHLAA
jgi:hypothetical protein